MLFENRNGRAGTKQFHGDALVKISIITVCYNAASTIEDTIQSVLAQEGVTLEYIIIDGASTDGTIEIIKKYSDQISVFRSESDKGMYDGLNKGIAVATGEIIGHLHADDLFYDSTVLCDVNAAFERQHCDCVYGNIEYVKDGNIETVVRKWISKPYRDGMFEAGWMPPHTGFFVRADVAKKQGAYRLDLGTAADYEWMLRLLMKLKCSSYYLPRMITRMRTGGASNISLSARYRANRNDKKAWTLNGLKPRWYTLLMKPLSKIVQFVNM